MSDDLNLLITFLSVNKTMVKVVLHIEHGMNNDVLPKWDYYNDPDVLASYKELLPLHVSNFMDVILEVEDIFWVSNSEK